MPVQLRSAALGCILLGLVGQASAQDKLGQLFNQQMLGANHDAFAAIAGPAERVLRNQHQYLIDGCRLTTEITYGQVSLLHLELSPDCHADLSNLLGADYSADQPPTVADFSKAFGQLEFYASCLVNCEKTAPVVYGLWKSGRTDSFEQISIEVPIDTPPAEEASQAWQEQMRDNRRERFIEESWVNCVRDYDQAAAGIFAPLTVSAISIGRQLYKPRCTL